MRYFSEMLSEKSFLMPRIVITSMIVVGLLGVSSPSVQAAAPPNTASPDQSELDKAQSYGGTWFDLAGGYTGRPYVSELSVVNNGVSTRVITGGTSTTENNVPTNRVAVAISPTNLCKTGQTPEPGRCYSTPNRIGITIGYQVGPGQLGWDFNNPAISGTINASTEFDMTINLNTIGKSLRWTWASGIPTYWNASNLGADNATIRIRLKPALMPIVQQGGQQVGCSQVPVQSCQYSQSTHETLSASLVLSLDETLDSVFTGALFSSSRSFMGSLMTQPGKTPQMTYGIAAPRTWSDGTENKAEMSAVLTDATILNFYGATPGVAATTDFQTNALNLIRTDGGTQGAIRWARWSADAQGSDGWLITIPEITFATATVGAQGVRASSASVVPAQFSVKAKTSQRVTTRRSGSRSVLTLRVSASACAKYTCRVVVSSIASKVGSSSKRLMTATVNRKSKSVLVNVSSRSRKGQRLSAMLQARKGSKWVYVSSSVTTTK